MGDGTAHKNLTGGGPNQTPKIIQEVAPCLPF